MSQIYSYLKDRKFVIIILPVCIVPLIVLVVVLIPLLRLYILFPSSFGCSVLSGIRNQNIRNKLKVEKALLEETFQIDFSKQYNIYMYVNRTVLMKINIDRFSIIHVKCSVTQFLSKSWWTNIKITATL